MKSSKIISAENIKNVVKDNDCIFISGFVGSSSPEEVLEILEKSFLTNGSPKNLELFFAAGFGDSKTKSRGLNHFAHEGMVKKIIAAHYGLAPVLADLIKQNKVKAYNYPQGVVSQMFRDIAAKKPGTISQVGLGTFIDPELGGGKLNEITTEDMIEKIILNKKEVLFFKAPIPNIGIIRGTTADEFGNISMEDEPLTLDTISLATAVRNNGGKVIVQVKKIVKNGEINPKDVVIPGIFVDYLILCENEENHKMNFGEYYNESYILSEKNKLNTVREKVSTLDERKIIARKAAYTLNCEKKILNYGIGVPEAIASVLEEEGISEKFIATVEAGAIGGAPASGSAFGASFYPKAIIDQGYQFDFYDGGGLDIAFLGLAQCDKYGNINVSKFGPKITGAGGFINITQNAKEVVFCGTFTASGLKIEIKDGKLNIIQEGKVKKFIQNVEQITFSGNLARKNRKKVLYITERAVFELKEEGLTLTEIAPGIDLKKDILDLMEFKPIIAENLKKMNAAIFTDKKLNLII